MFLYAPHVLNLNTFLLLTDLPHHLKCSSGQCQFQLADSLERVSTACLNASRMQVPLSSCVLIPTAMFVGAMFVGALHQALLFLCSGNEDATASNKL